MAHRKISPAPQTNEIEGFGWILAAHKLREKLNVMYDLLKLLDSDNVVVEIYLRYVNTL